VDVVVDDVVGSELRSYGFSVFYFGNPAGKRACIMAIPLENEIFYPESDGKPLAETELHIEELVYVWHALKGHFEDEDDVFVGANLFLYYRKGDPSAVVAPDNFVVKGVPKLLPGNRRRKKFLLWEEGKVPCFVLEVTSKSTRVEDIGKKKIYEKLGVDEYFQFDPFGEYLNPKLQGHRLVGGRYRPIRPNPDGSLLSRATEVVFRVEGTRLRPTDAATGESLLRNEEERQARRRAEEKATAEARARRQAEATRRQAEEKATAEVDLRRNAEEKVRALEEELKRLRGLG
jgi:Uma2 family endonuclease